MSKKILIVFGTRPEIIKLAPLILALNNSALQNKFLVACTSQHEDLLDIQLEYWGIKPNYYLTSSSNKGNLIRLLSHSISGLQDIIEQEISIEYIIVQGDTNTALACANIAFLNKLKLIHIEAGLRSFDLNNPFPEEFNRKVASIASHFHFAPTETSKLNLLNEGIDPSKIIVTGNTVIDALYLAQKRSLDHNNNNRRNVLITFHRRENIDNNIESIADIVYELAKQYPDLNFVWITHPNCANSIRLKTQVLNNIQILDHLPYLQFINLYDTAKMIITDSGGVSEEAIHLGLPIIIFRVASERKEPISEQYPMIISVDKNSVIKFFNENINIINETRYSYGEGNASQIITNWLCSNIN
jgi:UDP-N-acetylglucosamine 2-epimerase